MVIICQHLYLQATVLNLLQSTYVITKMEENMFEVEAILDKKVEEANGTVHYLILWKGYSREEASWEPAWTLSSIQSLIIKFQEELVAKKGKKNKTMIRRGEKQESQLHQKRADKGKMMQDKKRDKFIAKPNIRHQQIITNKYEQSRKQILPNKVIRPSMQKPSIKDREQIKNQNKPDLFTLKLQEKLKKNGVLKPQPEPQQTYQNIQASEADTVEVLKIIFKGPEHKRMFQIRVGNSIIQMQAVKTRKTYPFELCIFYERFLRFDP